METYYGDIMCFAFNFVQRGWLECNGQTLQIAQYQTLFTLIGFKFGGNGTTTFCVPNLNGASRHNGYMKFYIANTGIYPSWT
jgi:microcystin-dependent protein